ncbi:MAG: DNA primase [Bacteroidota bacterium]
MITEESVREVIETARIEDVVADFVSLRRRGQNFIGLCPFHNEKTPSFNVNPSRNIYKCFGCGEGGDPVKFLMTLEQLSFPDAIRWLAKKYNLKLQEKEVSPEMQQAKLEKDSLLLVNDYAKQWFGRQLFESEEGKSIGLTYFKSRGFREETIKKFGLGYAPSGRFQSGQEVGETQPGQGASTSGSLTKDAVQAGYKSEQLQRLGLSKNGRDFFYDRVMFTIHNLAGKPIAFAGRILKKDVKAPKYVNSPETEVYQKSKVLYGMFQARQAIRKLDQVYIVEGYTDVISLHQHGISNVVASSGTSLTSGQAALIKRFTNNATLLYDGDKAGIKAALRGVDVLLEQDLDVRVIILPEGEDPDSYMQSTGLEGFTNYLQSEAKDFLLFKAELLLGEESQDMAGKTRVVREMSDSLAKIDAPLKRSEYIKQFAGLLGIREDLLINQVNQAISNRRKELAKEQQREQWKQQREQGSGQRASRPAVGGPSVGGDGFPGEEPAWLGQDAGGDAPPVPDQAVSAEAPPPPMEEELHLGHGWQERYLARLLMVDGHKIYEEEEDISVGHFVLANTQDLLQDFDDSRYLAVVDHLQSLHTAGQESPPLAYWLNHSEVAFKQMAVDFSVEPHQYSDRWQEKFGIYLSQKHPEDNQVLNTTTFLHIFRKLKIDRKCRENAQKIQELAAAGDEAEVMIYLQLHQRLLELRNELADKLGTVVPPGG